MMPRVNRYARIGRRERDMGIDGRHGLGAAWYVLCDFVCFGGVRAKISSNTRSIRSSVSDFNLRKVSRQDERAIST